MFQQNCILYPLTVTLTVTQPKLNFINPLKGRTVNWLHFVTHV